MNIDLLMTGEGEAGLVADSSFKELPAGVMFDSQAHIMSIEFVDLENLEMNIPVQDSFTDPLSWVQILQIGVISDGKFEASLQVPLLLLNDPSNGIGRRRVVRSSRSVLVFENFMKRTTAGQPIHRDDLGAEHTADGVLAGLNHAVLQFAPHLARQRVLEASPHLAPQAPGLGLGGRGGGGRGSQPAQRRPPAGKKDDETR